MQVNRAHSHRHTLPDPGGRRLRKRRLRHRPRPILGFAESPPRQRTQRAGCATRYLAVICRSSIGRRAYDSGHDTCATRYRQWHRRAVDECEPFRLAPLTEMLRNPDSAQTFPVTTANDPRNAFSRRPRSGRGTGGVLQIVAASKKAEAAMSRTTTPTALTTRTDEPKWPLARPFLAVIPLLPDSPRPGHGQASARAHEHVAVSDNHD